MEENLKKVLRRFNSKEEEAQPAPELDRKDKLIGELEDKNKDLTQRSIKKISNLKQEIEELKGEIEASKKENIVQFHSETIGKISEALAKAQSTMDVAGKSVDGYKFKYANLTEYVKASRPHLTKNDLSVVQLIHSMNGEEYSLTILSHGASGEWFKSLLKIDRGSSGREGSMSLEQFFGLQNTYAKKYQYTGITGVVAEKEDDLDSIKK